MPRYLDYRGLEEYSTSSDVVVLTHDDAPTFKEKKVTLGTSAELNILDGATLTTAELNQLDLSAATTQPTFCQGVSFSEDGSGTSYVGTVPLPAASLLIDIYFVTLTLWDGTSATLKIGDDSDDDGWFTGVNLKATDLLVGEVLQMSNSEYWGGKNGAYLVAATGTRSAIYNATANNVIATVTPGAADGSAGRSVMWVVYTAPVLVASTNT